MRPASSPEGAAACRVRLEPGAAGQHPDLGAWRANVGAPVAVDCAAPAAARLSGIDVLSWNVAIGLGRLEEVVAHLRAGEFGGAAMAPDRPLVILLQEAFRAGDSVPGTVGSRYHGGRLPDPRGRRDIVEMALRLGLSLRYSPSMRNGDHPSDRGNAILCTAPLDNAEAVLLPFVRQRRVAVAASLAGHPGLTFVSAHLDTHGRLRHAQRSLAFGSGRAAQAAALADSVASRSGSVILGADLNSVLGMSDPAVRALVAAGMHPARRIGSWRHTFHSGVRLLLDHVLFRCDARFIDSAQVVRLDEASGDRTPGVFGSDHHPLLARIGLRDA
jgi:endonuclease/exonuclease/phosphatase family metal-dependent hydrolase